MERIFPKNFGRNIFLSEIFSDICSPEENPGVLERPK